ncbi:OmpA family protein [Zavarzinia compransoris]|uniref:OmpA family protein n=1 Tax=Zavarzinia marina TaxID=2911065 RepID=UPI001F41D12D|nr:OmpA family protein [Zavarzinia marina]MCF4165204.1 OmpA family protein [Zavarzinia marina]
MSFVSRSALVALMMAVGAPAAVADQMVGPYLGGYGAFVMPSSVDVEGDADGDGNQDVATMEFDNGFGVGALFGYDYGEFRFEADVGYRSFDTDKLTDLMLSDGAGGFTAVPDTPFSNNFGVLTVMGNVIYEYETQTSFTPYVGAGLGAAWVFVNDKGGSGGSIASGNDAGFAYQGILGGRVELSESLAAFADYRYVGTSDIQVNDFQTSYDMHSVQAGLIYVLDSYTPPPPPVPAPAPVSDAVLARSFMVFFDWDSSIVTEDASAIIKDAAQSAMNLGVSRIELTGHADRSGSETYNQALSLRRAAAVKAELIAIGIAESEIVTIGKGESAPLVPTPDGVREAQNRRVEIVLP